MSKKWTAADFSDKPTQNTTTSTRRKRWTAADFKKKGTSAQQTVQDTNPPIKSGPVYDPAYGGYRRDPNQPIYSVQNGLSMLGGEQDKQAFLQRNPQEVVQKSEHMGSGIDIPVKNTTTGKVIPEMRQPVEYDRTQPIYSAQNAMAMLDDPNAAESASRIYSKPLTPGQTLKYIGEGFVALPKDIVNIAGRQLANISAGMNDWSMGMANAARVTDRWLTEKVGNIGGAITGNPGQGTDYVADNGGMFVGNTLDGFINTLEKESAEAQSYAEQGASGIEKFLGQGVRAVTSMVPDTVIAVASGGASVPGLVAKFKSMWAFGLRAMGGYARDAENAKGNNDQQMLYGAIGGLVEMATEMIGFNALVKAIKVTGKAGEAALKPVVANGIRTFVKQYGNVGLAWLNDAFTNTVQETASQALTNTANKLIIDPARPWTGEGGVFDVKDLLNAGGGGLSMSLVMAALGLPATFISHQMAARIVESGTMPDAQESATLQDALTTDLLVFNNEQTNQEIQNQATQPLQNAAQQMAEQVVPMPEQVTGQPATGMSNTVTGQAEGKAEQKSETMPENEFKNKYMPAVQKEGEKAVPTSDKPIWEMDKDEYADYYFENLDIQREAAGAKSDIEIPQNKLYQELQGIENKYERQIESERKEQYRQNNVSYPEAGYEGRTDVINSLWHMNFLERDSDLRSEMKAEQKKAAEQYKILIHKAMIEDALRTGKPVPQKIIQEYPFLDKKYGNKPVSAGKSTGTPRTGEIGVGSKWLTSSGKTVAVQSVSDETVTIRLNNRNVNVPRNSFADLFSPTSKPPKPAENAKTELRVKNTGKSVTVKDNDGNPYDFQYAVVNAKDLVTSHDAAGNINPSYPQEMQPRDRERIASNIQINDIINKLNPERLGASPTLSDGAPIIGNDLAVESGNGRIIALQTIYKTGHKNRSVYMKWLKENAATFGIDPNSLPNNPVLVRVRTSEVDRPAFAKLANVSSVATMSATETAKSDSEKLNDRLLGLFSANNEGLLNTSANHGFISAFISDVIPKSEIGKYINTDGLLSQDGINRVRNAIFYKAYGNLGLMDKVAESTNNNIKTITNALINIAPRIVQIKSGIKNGTLYNLDFSSDISKAVDLLNNLKQDKISVDEYLNQSTMFDDGVPATSKAMLVLLDENHRSAKKLTDFYNLLFDTIEQAGDPNQINITDEKRFYTKKAVLADTIRRFGDGKVTYGQSSLDTQPGPGGNGEGRQVNRPSAIQKAAGEIIPGSEDGRSGNRESVSNQQEVDVPDEFKGETPPELDLKSEGGFVTLPGKKPTIQSSSYRFSDDELEAQHESAKLTPANILQKVGEWARDFALSATRTFKLIDPKLAKNSEFISAMVKYPKLKSIAGGRAVRIINDILRREGAVLSKEEYNLFNRYILLRDLKEETKANHPLPGKWTPAAVDAYLAEVESLLTDNTKEAVKRRDGYIEKIKTEYIAAMGKLGWNVKDRFNKKNYFRHMVLEYAQARITGSGNKINVKRSRGWLKQRHGSSMLINEDYLQAEYEVMASMIHDAEVAKLLRDVGDKYDIKADLKKKAKAQVDAAVAAIIEQERTAKDGEWIKRDGQPYFQTTTEKALSLFKRNIAIGFGKLKGLAEEGNLWDGNGEWADVVDNLAADDRVNDESSRLFRYLSALMDTEEAGAQEAAMIFKAVTGRKTFIKALLKSEYVEWQDIIPEGYAEFYPIIGKHFYAASAITESLANALMSGNLKEVGLSDMKVQKIMAMGSSFNSFVIPAEYQSTMENVYGNIKNGAIDNIVAAFMKGWKKWQLHLNPWRFVKYNLRNASGDFERLMDAAGIKGINPVYSKRSAVELWNAMRFNKFTKDLVDFREMGGMEDNLYVQEIADVNNAKIFKDYQQKGNNLLQKVLRIPKTWDEFSSNATQYRENILRYAAYLYYKQDLQAHNGKPTFYGASIRARIDGLSSLEDKAYQLSKDAIGAYDEVTEFGRWFRKYIFAFWSFQETNLKAYKRIVQNTIHDDTVTEAFGKHAARSLGVTLRLSTKALVKIGSIALRVSFFTLALALWNRLVMGDEDDDLDESIRDVPHITLGRAANGDVIYFSRLGSLSDLLEWFNLNSLPQDIQDIADGREKFGHLLEEMAKGPVNKIVNGLTPYLKIPAELLAGKQYYPDAFKPRTIRDLGQYAASQFGLQSEYDRITRKPVKESYVSSWINALVYRSDPEQAAYYTVLDLKNRYRQNVLKEFQSQAFNDSPKSKALYYFKLALKYGDQKSADKYLTEYYTNGGTDKGLSQSLATLEPLYGLNDAERGGFYEWLRPEERTALEKAYKYYDDTLGGGQ